jgi:hypothetical protein
MLELLDFQSFTYLKLYDYSPQAGFQVLTFQNYFLVRPVRLANDSARHSIQSLRARLDRAV